MNVCTSSLIGNVTNSPYPSYFLYLLSIGDTHLAAPDIHRGTHVLAGDGLQIARPYMNIRQENLRVSCAEGKKI